MHCLACFDDLRQGFFRAGRVDFAPETAGLQRRDRTRLLGEVKETLIAAQKLDAPDWIVAVIERVGEVQRPVSGHELKFIRQSIL